MSTLRNAAAEALVRDSGPGGPSTTDLRDLCPDPMELFVLHPQRLRVQELAKLYAEDIGEIPGLIREFNGRSARERWADQRTRFQSARFESRQEAIIEHESAAWAVMAVDFTMGRIRGLFTRWDFLSGYVEEQLLLCAEQARGFAPDLRDACVELAKVEAQLIESLPSIGVESIAAKKLTQAREGRGELIEQVKKQLTTLQGADDSANVLRLLRGGKNEMVIVDKAG